MSNRPLWILKGFALRVSRPVDSRRLGAGLLLLAGLLAMASDFWQSQAHSRDTRWLIAANVSPSALQAQGMAGYVLNSETNMNTAYTRKLNRELMNPPAMDDGPLIQYQGPPPQAPPSGPIFQTPNPGSGRP